MDIASDFELREAGAPRIATWSDPIRIDDGRRLGLPEPEGSNARSADASRVRVAAPGVGRFLVVDGRHIVAWAAPEATTATLSQQLTGPILAVAMMQRGILVLHASVVAIRGRAVVIMGHAGLGKSTTAAACAACGHDMVADDIAPIDIGDDGLTVRSMPPIVRLADPAALGAGGRPRWRAADKTAVPMGERRLAEHLPVAAIAQLEDGDGAAAAVRRLGRASAVLTLIEHAFCRPVFQEPQAVDHLARCAQVAARCPVVVLSRPRALGRLPELVPIIERLAAVCP